MRLTAAKAASRHVRSAKTYRLASKIPAGMRPSIGRRILAEVGRRQGAATTQKLRGAMKRGASDATLRFYLGKFQREGLVVASEL
jgi:hypothetical protein